MSSGRPKVTFRCDPGVKQRVERWAERHENGNASDAWQRLARCALREREQPLFRRAVERGRDAAYHLTLAGGVIGLVGFGAPSVNNMAAVRVAVLLWITALMLAGAVEFVRGVAGANELGEQVRVWVGGEGT